MILLAARRDGVVVHRLADEVVGYDRRTAQAHSLNAAAGSLFEQAGETSVVQIAATMAVELGVSTNDELVAAGLQRLECAALRDAPFDAARCASVAHTAPRDEAD